MANWNKVMEWLKSGDGARRPSWKKNCYIHVISTIIVYGGEEFLAYGIDIIDDELDAEDWKLVPLTKESMRMYPEKRIRIANICSPSNKTREEKLGLFIREAIKRLEKKARYEDLLEIKLKVNEVWRKYNPIEDITAISKKNKQ